METTRKPTQNSTNVSQNFAQQWPQLRSQVKEWWDRLTEADLEQVAGDKERLMRALQDRYGYARERAEQELNRRLAEVSDTSETSRLGQFAESAAHSAQDVASEVQRRAGEVSSTAQKMATTAASAVADTVSRAGTYMPEFSSGLAGVIRRYPLPALLVGMGLGFLLGRGMAGMGGITGQGGGSPEPEVGYPDALIQCSKCSQMVRQADIVEHSLTCTGQGQRTTGGSTS